MPVVRASLYASDDWRKPPKVLFDRTPAGFLDRGAALDDARGRGGPTQRRLLKVGSQQRARRLRGILGQRCTPQADNPYVGASAMGQPGSEGAHVPTLPVVAAKPAGKP